LPKIVASHAAASRCQPSGRLHRVGSGKQHGPRAGTRLVPQAARSDRPYNADGQTDFAAFLQSIYDANCPVSES